MIGKSRGQKTRRAPTLQKVDAKGQRNRTRHSAPRKKSVRGQKGFRIRLVEILSYCSEGETLRWGDYPDGVIPQKARREMFRIKGGHGNSPKDPIDIGVVGGGGGLKECGNSSGTDTQHGSIRRRGQKTALPGGSEGRDSSGRGA